MTMNAPAMTSLHQAAEEIRQRHIAAVNTGDVESATGIFGSGGVFLPPGAPALQGPAIRAWFDQVFGAFRLEGFAIRPEVQHQNGDILIEHGDWGATFHPKNGGSSLAAAGTYLTVYERQADGSVCVIRDTFTGMP